MSMDTPNYKMFVADMLMDGLEDLSSILAMLNDPRIGGWRNVVATDFTFEHVLLALGELIRLRYIDAWHGENGYLVAVVGDVADMLALAEADPDSTCFRLTIKGRKAVEAWDFPTLQGEVVANYAASADVQPLAQIADPSTLLAKLKERNPRFLQGFADQKIALHVIVGEGDTVSVGTGPMREFMEKTRWSRGLPGLGNLNIRHITLDETGKIVRDYYGPASSDASLTDGQAT